MTAGAYTEFYTEVYRPLVSAYHGRLIDAESIQDEQRDYASARADFIEPQLRERSCKTLLDVGGSTGVVAHVMKERFDLLATVIDPAPLEIEVARALGLKTVTGFVEDYEPGWRHLRLHRSMPDRGSPAGRCRCHYRRFAS